MAHDESLKEGLERPQEWEWLTNESLRKRLKTTRSMFRDDSRLGDVGNHVTRGSHHILFCSFMETLSCSPELIGTYNLVDLLSAPFRTLRPSRLQIADQASRMTDLIMPGCLLPS